MKDSYVSFCILAFCAVTIGIAPACGDTGIGQQGDGTGFVFDSFGFDYPAGGPSSTIVEGFDLDGRNSRADSPAGDECAHDDFTSSGGTEGIDYGFLNMIEEFSGFQQGQIVDGVIDGAIKSGAMTVVLELGDLDDLDNDDAVTIQLFSSLDAPRTGADGNVLPGGSVTIHPDTRFHTDVVSGELVEGVLTAGPIDLRWRLLIQVVDDEFFVHDAMIRLELKPDGSVTGIISGLWDVEDIRRIIISPTSVNGMALEFDEEEGMAALRGYADADYNADTEMCEAIATTFRFGATPHFIVR